MGLKLRGLSTQVVTTCSRLKTSEVAEALIATWCVEFLRVRKIGGLNVVQIVTISVLMLGVKTIITEASRRRYGGKDKSTVVSNRTTSVESMGIHGNSYVPNQRVRRTRRYQRRDHRDPYENL